MKALMICTTSNMVYAAIQIKRFDLVKDDVDIIVTDYSSGMDKAADHLKDLGLFHTVYYSKVRDHYMGGSLLHKIRKTVAILEPENRVISRFGIEDLSYDAFYFVVFDIPAYQLYYHIRKHNPKAEFHKFEEGYSSYTVYNQYVILDKVTTIISQLLHIPKLEDSVKEMHLFEPDWLIYPIDYPVKSIPRFNKNLKVDVDLLNAVFGYRGEAKEYEGIEYIIFEDAFFADHLDIDDFEVLSQVLDYIGRDKAAIKLHPRNKKNRFPDIKLIASNIPWEIVQLNGDFSSTKFITVTSGAVLGSFLWLNDQVETIMIYNCLSNKPPLVDNNFEVYINRIVDKSHGKLHIPKSFEELKSFL